MHDGDAAVQNMMLIFLSFTMPLSCLFNVAVCTCDRSVDSNAKMGLCNHMGVEDDSFMLT